jgi:hypothetical protein
VPLTRPGVRRPLPSAAEVAVVATGEC